MFIYITVFIVSCLATKLASQYRGKRSLFFSAVAVLLPCYIAGVRDLSIGTDVTVYVVPIFRQALQYNFVSFMRNASTEPMFRLISYLVVRCTGSIYVLLFVIELLIIVPVYCAIQRITKGSFAWLGMAMFYLFHFASTLNYMRQSIAVAIILLAFSYLQEGKTIVYCLLVVVAIMFHITAVCGFGMWLIYMLIGGAEKEQIRSKLIQRLIEKNKPFFISITIIAIVFVLVFLKEIIVFAINLTGRFQYQYDHITSSFSFGASQTLVLLVTIMIMALFYRQSIKNNVHIRYMFYFLIFGVIMYQATGISHAMGRMSLYLTYFLTLLIPQFVGNVQQRDNRRILSCIMIIIMSSYFYFSVVVKVTHHIYPYTSKILGIR